jgi:hypothetical protein
MKLNLGSWPITGIIEGYNPKRSSSRLQKGNSWSLSTLLRQSRLWKNRKDTRQIFRSGRYAQQTATESERGPKKGLVAILEMK